MLGGGNSGGGIQYDKNQSSNSPDDTSQAPNDMDDEIPF
jgi:single-strand DNA-binding protein